MAEGEAAQACQQQRSKCMSKDLLNELMGAFGRPQPFGPEAPAFRPDGEKPEAIYDHQEAGDRRDERNGEPIVCKMNINETGYDTGFALAHAIAKTPLERKRVEQMKVVNDALTTALFDAQEKTTPEGFEAQAVLSALGMLLSRCISACPIETRVGFVKRFQASLALSVALYVA